MTRRVVVAIVALGLLLGACKSDNGDSGIAPLPTTPRRTTTSTTTVPPVGAPSGAYGFARTTSNHTSGTYKTKPFDKTTKSIGSPRVSYSTPTSNEQYVFGKDGSAKYSEVVTYASGAATMSALRTVAANGTTTRFRPDPPVILYPADLAVGSKWNWSITSLAETGKKTTTRAASFEAVRAEDLTIGDVTLTCIVIEGTTTIDGDKATIKTTSWYAPTLKFAVLENQITDYKFTGTGTDLAVHLDQTTKLVDTRPNHVE